MKKPKNMTLMKMPAEQPDCCANCPLCGMIPKGYTGKPKGSKETHVCLGTMEALTGRGIKVLASKRDKNHPLRRPCDHKWDAWMKLPERMFSIPDELYLECRVPYERTLQFTIKFHKNVQD